MNVLLVDDEAGIREGLALFLRLKGHTVRTAASAAAAGRVLGCESFDVVVTDWVLPDGSGEAILESCQSPVIAMSGNPEMVSGPGLALVLTKPVPPPRLQDAIEGLAAQSAREPERVLPADTADRVALALALLGDPRDVEMLDDGEFTLLRAGVPAVSEEQISRLELIGGDLRVWGPPDGLRVELRLCRDGRPERIGVCRPWDDASDWPDPPEAVALDLSGHPPGPQEFLGLLDLMASARESGRVVHLLNVPPHLRLFAEICGRAHDMPKRERAGPRLPEVLARLWS